MAEELATLIGLAVIAAVVWFYTETLTFPGLTALPPCLGATLLIYGGRAKYAGLLLRNPISVGIGRISYSVYLVHWPIIVFYRLANPGPIALHSAILLVVASVVAGGLMYRLVETPFRHGSRPMMLPSRTAFYGATAAFIVALVVPAALMRASNGWEWRYPPGIQEQMQVNFDKEYAWTNLNRLNQPFTNASGPKTLIVGDSQAGDFLNMLLASHAADGMEIRSEVIQGECQAVLPRSAAYYDVLREPYNTYCRRYHESFMASGKIERADNVILASSWQLFGIGEINNTVAYLLSHGVKRVFVVGKKDQGLSGQALLRKYWTADDIDRWSARLRSDEALNINRMIRDTLKDATYIDVMHEFCPAPTSCRVMTPDRKIIFSDIMHLTEPGTSFMASILAKDGVFPSLNR